MEKERGILAPTRKTEKPAGLNYLLVIALDRHQDARFESLSNCAKDAGDLIGVLTADYQFREGEVLALFNEQATKSAIHHAFEQLRERIQPGDSLLIYYAGHGEVERDKTGIVRFGYWIPCDAEKGEAYTYFSSSTLRDQLSLIDSFHTVLIVDACFGDAIFTKTRGASGSGSENYRSSLALTSTKTEEKAEDGYAGGNSPFADILLSELRENNQPLGFYKLADSVKERVQRATNQRQNPSIHSLALPDDEGGEFFFNPKAEAFFIDGNGLVYPTLERGDRIWMARNYNLPSDQGSTHFHDEQFLGKHYGRLYTWEAAQEACPAETGWRLPTLQDWEALLDACGTRREAYEQLIAGGGAGFNAVLGGYRSSRPNRQGHYTYKAFGGIGAYWTATEAGSDKATRIVFYKSHGKVDVQEAHKGYGFSVRYVRESY